MEQCQYSLYMINRLNALLNNATIDVESELRQYKNQDPFYPCLARIGDDSPVHIKIDMEVSDYEQCIKYILEELRSSLGVETPVNWQDSK